MVKWAACLAIAAHLATTSGWAKVICSEEEYVRTGLEFSMCQDMALHSFEVGDGHGNPCPAMSHIVYSCAETIRQCFDQRGWERGRRVLLELLSLEYTNWNECGVFNASLGDAKHLGEIPQKVDGELCSIDDEVALLHDLMSCTNEAQTRMISNLMKKPPAPVEEPFSSQDHLFYFPVFCEGLQHLNDKCYSTRLHECYESTDLEYHKSYLLEELKISAITLSSHLITQSKDLAIVDVASCPVFQSRMSKAGVSDAIITVIVLVTMLAILILVLATVFLLRNFRLVPKLRARLLENTPYEDIVITEQEAPQTSGGGRNVFSPSSAANRNNNVVRNGGIRDQVEDDNNRAVRSQVETNNIMISSLSRDLEVRQKTASSANVMVVNSFTSPDDTYGSPGT